VTFHIAKGEFVFLTGHSGAGKSTVLKLVYADEPVTSGEVRVSGFNVRSCGLGTSRCCAAVSASCSRTFACSRPTAEENVAFASK